MKLIIALLITVSIIMPQTNVQEAPKPIHDSAQLRVEDMLMLFLTANIYEVVGVYLMNLRTY
jgi:hypothetical protein